jgi:two-component system chemotaxis sensor kinase CheA
MNELQQQFISESKELVLQATDDLMAVERSGFDAERIDRVFRAFHTLKGSAGVVNLPAMGLLLHAAEDLLAAVNAKKRPITTGLVSEALECLDQVSAWVDAFEARGVLPSDAGERARDAALRLRALLSDNTSSRSTPNRHGPVWAAALMQEVAATDASDNALLAVAYEPLPGCFFNGDDPLALVASIPNLLALSIEPREPWPPLPDIDPFACNLRIHAITATTRDELAAIFRLVPDQVEIFDLAPVTTPTATAAPDTKTTALLDDIIACQIDMLNAGDAGDNSYGRYGSAARAAAHALRHFERDDLASEVEAALESAIAQQNGNLVRDALRRVTAALAAPSEDRDRDPDSPAAPSRSLRIDEGHVDSLFNLSGELIVAKNSLAHLSKLVETVVGDGDLGRSIRRANENLDRLITDMHSAILQLRMVPVSQLFRSFPRVARDLSLRLDKRAELTIQGGTAECDKTLVERLFEPLLHLVRNAIDHGIEAPEERRAAGKPEQAHIALEAARTGDRLTIEVRDDGRGIDPAAIRAKALERGLMSADEIAALSDEKTTQLIFSAGLSTATAVTDISGRGVGMDVVRNTVEQLGGKIAIASRLGAGTTVRLDLPVNVAMSQIVVVEASGQFFGLPMDVVNETLRLTPDRVSRIKNNRGFVLRDRVVPICSLAEALNLPDKPADDRADHLVVVAEAAGKIIALQVDGIHDRLDAVLKPMKGLLANAPAYSGTTMTADGRVLLVLDLKELFS